MDKTYYFILAKVRMERAEELLTESKLLLEKEAYKSANNRAFYAIEKVLKGLLASKEIEAATHNGCLKQFNFHFIHNGDHTFTSEDYQKISYADQIRNASDYDDFYVANKEETKELVIFAEQFVKKVREYLIRIHILTE
ncbi:MAG: HEPN domain-containing protein [Schaedlerella sp.]|uniref:HEPN domain-containing protein n=1 Tax=Schaedlerella sp. TaxID=2676057 RepID=UPI00265E5648|nr:HEPN domain-containing protein [uncultured Schaedlerella sp.]